MRAVPRYPSNVYYNVSRQGQQLDEYNWIYVAPANGGGCVPIAGVTTCRTTPATWAEYVASETRVMFRHLTGNDPRPHFFHQSNLADYNPALPDTDPDQGGILYPVIDALVGRYEAAFDRAGAPLRAAHLDADRRHARAPGRVGGGARPRSPRGCRTAAYTYATAAPRRSPCRSPGTTAGDLYGGQRSGWVSLAAGAEADVRAGRPGDHERARRHRHARAWARR